MNSRQTYPSKSAEDILNASKDPSIFNVGLLGAIAIHLFILVIFLMSKVAAPTAIPEQQNIVMDFKEQEFDVKEEIKQEKIEQQEKIEELLAQKMIQEFKNISVNRAAAVKEEFNTEKLMSELASQYNLGNEPSDDDSKSQEDAVPIVKKETQKTAPKEDQNVGGPTLIEYFLKDRIKRYIKNPVYICETFGKVTVDIKVNQEGTVVDALFNPSKSSVNDECLITTAVNAAKSSRFNVNFNAPVKQEGYITYIFMAQY